MGRIKQFKHKLGQVFDANLETKQWGNYVDYTIVGLIILSTLSVFISTFDISEGCEYVLHVIDIVTVIIFTIEVSLRIWTADELSPKYKGFWGRVRYCLTFYGMIDILSTYTFYLAFIFPLPYQVLKSLRVVRVYAIVSSLTAGDHLKVQRDTHLTTGAPSGDFDAIVRSLLL